MLEALRQSLLRAISGILRSMRVRLPAAGTLHRLVLARGQNAASSGPMLLSRMGDVGKQMLKALSMETTSATAGGLLRLLGAWGPHEQPGLLAARLTRTFPAELEVRHLALAGTAAVLAAAKLLGHWPCSSHAVY